MSDIIIESDDYITIVSDTEQGPAGPAGADANPIAPYLLAYAATGLPNSAVLQASTGLLITNSGGILTISATGGGTGTVTSVAAGNLASFATVNVATPTTTPAITFTLTQAGSGQAFMGPVSGNPAAPGYRNLVLSDLPAGTYTVNSGNLLNNFATGSGTGILAQNGSSLAFRVLTGTGNRLTVANGDGGSGNPTFDVGSDVYTKAYSNVLNNLASGVPTAGQVLIGNSAGTYTLATIAAGTGIQVNVGSGFINIAASGAQGGTVTNFSAGDLAPLFTTTEATTTTTPALTFVPSNAASASFVAGPLAGVPGAYTFRNIASSDISGALAGNLIQGSNITITRLGDTFTISSTASSGGGGSVTQVTSGNLTNFATVNVATNTTTPAFTFTLTTAASGQFWRGPTSGVAAAPSYGPIVLSDLPVGTYTVNYSNILNNLASGSGTGILAQNGGVVNYRTITGTAGRVTVSNGDGSGGNPTLDVGTNVYTTSTSSLLNKLASATPANGQIPIGNGVDFTIANLTAGPGIQITNGTGSITLGNYASAALLTAGDLSPLFTTTEAAQTLTFVPSNANAGTALMGPVSGGAGAYTFRNLASGDFGANQITPSQIGNNVINMGILIDNGASAITAQDEGQFPVGFPVNITGWTLLSYTGSGSCVVNIYKSSYASFPVMTSIIGSGTKPSISSGYKGQNLAINDWTTTSVNTGEILKFSIESISGFQQLTIALTAVRQG